MASESTVRRTPRHAYNGEDNRTSAHDPHARLAAAIVLQAVRDAELIAKRADGQRLSQKALDQLKTIDSTPDPLQWLRCADSPAHAYLEMRGHTVRTSMLHDGIGGILARPD